jgi:hypothetical protein
MRSLFFKIFLCFWLSHMLAVMLVYIIMSAREAQMPEPPRRGGRFLALPSRTIALHARTAAAIYEQDAAGETSNEEALNSYLQRIQNKAGLRAALFDASNTQVSSRDITPEFRLWWHVRRAAAKWSLCRHEAACWQRAVSRLLTASLLSLSRKCRAWTGRASVAVLPETARHLLEEAGRSSKADAWGGARLIP